MVPRLKGLRGARQARRAVLYGCAGLVVWCGARAYSRLAERVAALEQPPPLITVTGELGADRLRQALARTGSSPEEAKALAAALNKAGGTGRAHPGDHFRLVRDLDGGFRHLTLFRGLKQVVATAAPGAKGFKTRVSNVPVYTVKRQASGLVTGNLWLSMSRKGIPDPLIGSYTDVFQWTMDFLTECHDGDRYSVAWNELRSPDGREWGRTIQAAVYNGRAAGRQVAVLFNGDYFDARGKSMQRMFLRAPLNYRRISSSFSNGRYHPILRRYRPHHGTDYAAAYGAPVSAVGAGRVSAAGFNGGMGRRVEIRHNGAYTTVYGHLSGLAKGVYPGAAVRQGQVIGYVGSTGLATGPHLHFQISKNGDWVNFMRLNIPMSTSVPKPRLGEFSARRDELLAAMGESLAAGGGTAR